MKHIDIPEYCIVSKRYYFLTVHKIFVTLNLYIEIYMYINIYLQTLQPVKLCCVSNPVIVIYVRTYY